jgi:hypothetical protein
MLAAELVDPAVIGTVAGWAARLSCQFGAPGRIRTDDPFDYESLSGHLAGATACHRRSSREWARLLSMALIGGVTAVGMTKRMTRVASSHGQIPSLEGCLSRLRHSRPPALRRSQVRDRQQAVLEAAQSPAQSAVVSE